MAAGLIHGYSRREHRLTTSGGLNDRNRAISKMFEITSASIESRWEDGTNASTAYSGH